MSCSRRSLGIDECLPSASFGTPMRSCANQRLPLSFHAAGIVCWLCTIRLSTTDVFALSLPCQCFLLPSSRTPLSEDPHSQRFTPPTCAVRNGLRCGIECCHRPCNRATVQFFCIPGNIGQYVVALWPKHGLVRTRVPSRAYSKAWMTLVILRGVFL